MEKFTVRIFDKYITPQYIINNLQTSGVLMFLLLATVTPTDRPKSFRNRCVIEGFGDILCCHLAFWTKALTPTERV